MSCVKYDYQNMIVQILLINSPPDIDYPLHQKNATDINKIISKYII